MPTVGAFGYATMNSVRRRLLAMIPIMLVIGSLGHWSLPAIRRLSSRDCDIRNQTVRFMARRERKQWRQLTSIYFG